MNLRFHFPILFKPPNTENNITRINLVGGTILVFDDVDEGEGRRFLVWEDVQNRCVRTEKSRASAVVGETGSGWGWVGSGEVQVGGFSIPYIFTTVTMQRKSIS